MKQQLKMEIISATLAVVITGTLVIMGMVGLVQEIIRRKKIMQHLKQQKKKDRQI
jgi:putative effector of murein hydrolase LrgA (UPF0299 family)